MTTSTARRFRACARDARPAPWPAVNKAPRGAQRCEHGRGCSRIRCVKRNPRVRGRPWVRAHACGRAAAEAPAEEDAMAYVRCALRGWAAASAGRAVSSPLPQQAGRGAP